MAGDKSVAVYELQDYLTVEGRDPIQEWLSSLVDRTAKVRIAARIQRMAAGNFGSCRPLSEGVWELKIDHGPGYRIYYARSGNRVILLLCGGDKRRQHDDVQTAVQYWKDWQWRNHESFKTA